MFVALQALYFPFGLAKSSIYLELYKIITFLLLSYMSPAGVCTAKLFIPRKKSEMCPCLWRMTL